MKGYLSAMKRFLRTIAIFLLICMMMSFAACATLKEEEIAPEYSSELSETDFMGANFSFFLNNSHQSTGEDYLGYLINTEFSDLAKERINEVEKTYNVEISIVTNRDINQTIQNETYAGQVSADAVQTSSQGLAGSIRAGFMHDLAALTDYLDYRDSEKWGNIETIKALCWDGGIFGVIPAAWPMLKYYSMDGPLIVNEDIIRYLNQTDPREFVETNEWTWDKFEELMPVYNHVNDAGDEVTALFTSIHWLFRTMQSSNGEGFIVRDENDEYQLGLHSEKTFEAMDTAWNWSFGDYSSFVDIGGYMWDHMLQTFIDGKSVMTIVCSTELLGTHDSIAYNMSNFGFIPFPRGPHGDNKNFTGATITGSLFCTGIPLHCKDPAMSAILLDKIYEPLPGYEEEQNIIEYLRKNYFFDDRDVVNFIDAYNSIIYNYRYEALTDVYISINSSKSMREWLDQYAEADENNRQKYVVNIETSVEELFN